MNRFAILFAIAAINLVSSFSSFAQTCSNCTPPQAENLQQAHNILHGYISDDEWLDQILGGITVTVGVDGCGGRGAACFRPGPPPTFYINALYFQEGYEALLASILYHELQHYIDHQNDELHFNEDGSDSLAGESAESEIDHAYPKQLALLEYLYNKCVQKHGIFGALHEECKRIKREIEVVKRWLSYWEDILKLLVKHHLCGLYWEDARRWILRIEVCGSDGPSPEKFTAPLTGGGGLECRPADWDIILGLPTLVIPLSSPGGRRPL